MGQLSTISSLLLLLLAGAGCASLSTGDPSKTSSGIVQSGFIGDPPKTPSSHASVLCETPEGVMATWFGGPYERHPTVTIWTARWQGRGWSTPVEVADGIQANGPTRYPCWNPILVQAPHGPLLLFYKVGPSPDSWWGMLKTSTDGGATWSAAVRLPDGQVGPVRNPPIFLPDGSLLCGSSTEDHGWQIHMERTSDLGAHWERTPPLNQTNEFQAIQPTLLQWPAGGVQILNRTRREGVITECWMGRTWREWSPMHAIDLPNPNSAIAATMLKDGRGLLVYNHTRKGRTPLNVAISKDGHQWEAGLVLENEPGEYSYPSVIQSRDGLVHITYTWRRERIKHVVIDPTKLLLRKIQDGRWPSE